MRRVVLAFVALSLIGCELPRSRANSTLLIAVEGLGFDDLDCDTDSETAHRNQLCQEAVRFTHAYAPSTLSQATLASVLTGLYPLDHGVHQNGSDFLSARFSTVAEHALSSGQRTLFVSGGPPIWRKSGLAQGFEVFDDVFDMKMGAPYRPAEEVVRLGWQWLDTEASGQSFFMVLFLSDLQFPQVPTRTSDGEWREKSLSGQLQEINESLDGLFDRLKASKRWNSTNIVLLGLNGRGSATLVEPAPLSLKSDSVQVTLWIKPARRERDNTTHWTVDRNVGLVDLGATLHEWLGAPTPKSSIESLQPQTLSSALDQPEPTWDEKRLILSETGWPDWLEGGGVRYAIRQAQFLYIHDKKPLLFNTLTDRLEALPLKSSDPLWMTLNAPVLSLLAQAKMQPFQGMKAHWPDRLEQARLLWSAQEPLTEGHFPWLLQGALSRRDWREVRRLAGLINDPVAAYVAMRQLGEGASLPKHACLRLLMASKGDKKLLAADCDDERALALYQWQQSRSDEERNQAQERFLRLHVQYVTDQEIGRANYLNQLRWDVDRSWPELPQTTDYVLASKEFEVLAKKASALLSSKDRGL